MSKMFLYFWAQATQPDLTPRKPPSISFEEIFEDYRGSIQNFEQEMGQLSNRQSMLESFGNGSIELTDRATEILQSLQTFQQIIVQSEQKFEDLNDTVPHRKLQSKWRRTQLRELRNFICHHPLEFYIQECLAKYKEKIEEKENDTPALSEKLNEMIQKKLTALEKQESHIILSQYINSVRETLSISGLTTDVLHEILRNTEKIIELQDLPSEELAKVSKGMKVRQTIST